MKTNEKIRNYIAVTYETMVLQMKKALVRPMYRFCLIANPIVNTILFYEMFLNSGQENFGTYVILGAGLMGLWACICFSSAGDINRERWDGTLSLIFVAPTGFERIIAGKIWGNTLLALLTMVISYLTGKVLFRTSMTVAHPGYFLLALGMTVVTFAVVSKVIAYLLTLSRKTTLYMNCIELPIVFVCGFVVPVEELPAVVQCFSALLPPTWAVKLLRIAVTDQMCVEKFWQTFGFLVLGVLVYSVISALLGKEMERQVRIQASLEVS